MAKQSFISLIDTEGKMLPDVKKQFVLWITAHRNKVVKISCELFVNKRSLAQNDFHFAVVVPMCKVALNDVGYRFSDFQTHDYLKKNTITCKEICTNIDTGEVFEREKHSSELNVKEWSDWLAELQQYGAENLGIVIPDPNLELKKRWR